MKIILVDEYTNVEYTLSLESPSESSGHKVYEINFNLQSYLC